MWQRGALVRFEKEKKSLQKAQRASGDAETQKMAILYCGCRWRRSRNTFENQCPSRSEPSIHTFCELRMATSCAISWMNPLSLWQNVPAAARTPASAWWM